ncbi:hypothetical protein J6590_105142, partial [Homalodisca vitripennis]
GQDQPDEKHALTGANIGQDLPETICPRVLDLSGDMMSQSPEAPIIQEAITRTIALDRRH